MSRFNFAKKVALITGSSSGIGAAAAKQFAESGAKVVITGHEQEGVERMVKKIEQISGEKPLSLVGDITDDLFAEHLVNETVSRYGQIDVLFNNAGSGCVDGTFNDPQLMDKYDLMMNLNVRSLVKMTHLCVPHLAKTKGNIVNNGSIAGFVPMKYANSMYGTSKAALKMITQSAARDLGSRGIRVNSVE